MATAAPMRLTKARISAFVLEGTAAVVCIVLVAWLLLWFLTREIHRGGVAAYYVAADDVGIAGEELPFQRTEVRRFRRLPPSQDAQETAPERLVESVLAEARRGGPPLVVYVSAPVVPSSTRASGRVQELLRALAKSAQRDVLLALDLAQLDSAREIGVYGSSPYPAIERLVREVGEPDRNVFVLTSAAPAQKSWTADGLGESIFAHCLRTGLEGEAKGWDPNNPREITVAGLHHYVLDRVQRWSKLHRQSVQTPELHVVSASEGARSGFRIQPIPPFEDRPASILVAEPVAKSAESETGKSAARGKTAPDDGGHGPPPAPNGRGAKPSLEPLIEEWRKHDALKQRRSPYRHAPRAWQSYESALLRAERALRAAFHDPAYWGDRAAKALRIASERRAAVEQDLANADEIAKSFRFQPVRQEPEGLRELAAALDHLGVKRPEWLEDVRTEPASARTADAPQAGDPKVRPAAPAPPPQLIAASAGNPPDRYLELQLPAWAYRFNHAFERADYFREPTRSRLLARLVELRCDAEEALGTDRRGLAWIEPLVKRSDDRRRLLQDRLFGMRSDGTATVESDPDLAKASADYATALSVIKAFHRARDVWEEAASELAHLGEWAVRKRAIEADGHELAGDALPATVQAALKALRGLGSALRPPDSDRRDGVSSEGAVTEAANALTAAARDVEESMSELKRRFGDATTAYSSGATPRWTELDAALRVPLIKPEKRKEYIERLVAEEAKDAAADVDRRPAKVDGAGPADRGFWVRATGLAQLELALRRLSESTTGADTGERTSPAAVWGKICQDPDDPGLRRGEPFDSINKDVARDREQSRKHLAAETRREADRDASDAEGRLAALERLCRWAPGVDGSATGTDLDKAIRDYDAWAACACLEFHVSRLQADYTEKLGSLPAELNERRAALGLRAATAPAGRAETLDVVVKPSVQLKISDDYTSEFELAVRPHSGPETGGRAVPPGSAFVGVVGLVPGLLIDGTPAGDELPGRHVRVPADPPSLAAAAFKVRQEDEVKLDRKQDSVSLKAVLFYRGRDNAKAPLQMALRPKPVPGIKVWIGPDEDQLRAKYPDRDQVIQDQFALHEGEGWLHKGKDLHYVIWAQNEKPGPVTVAYRSHDQNADPPPWGREQTLAPRQRVVMERGTVAASKVAGGMAHARSFELLEVGTAGGEGKIAKYPIKFFEAPLDRYIHVDDKKIMLLEIEENGVRKLEDCYVVEIRRKADDPMTEPMLRDDLLCEFSTEGRSLKLIRGSVTGAKYFWPDQSIKFYYTVRGIQTPIVWRAEVEEQRVPKSTAPR